MQPASRLSRQLQEAIACLERAARATDAVQDPYRALDDLMVVVEALCPVWPPRKVGGPMNDLRL